VQLAVLCVLLAVFAVFVDEYWCNSQYCVHLHQPDRSVFSRCAGVDKDKCVMVVSLMQKNSRRNRMRYNVQRAEVAMSFDLYKVLLHRVCLLLP